MTLRSWTHTGYTQKIVFGTDAVDRLGEVVKEVGGRRVLLVTTAGRRDSDAGQRVVRSLGRALVSVFDGVRPHVPTAALQAALGQAADDNVDAVVSFGGGSCSDLAKGVCFFTEQQAGMSGRSFADKPL
ncbi:MAG: maleylacetate reductase, partial [Acidimicrobiaceae bacterium]|nr:maleylacetate reductase [Acidimicrobiaceae bacterium]